MIFEMKLRPHPYDLIKGGTKTVEVRLFDEKRSKIKAGDLILFKKEPYLHEMMYKKVGGVSRFSSFSELFAAFPKEALGSENDETAEKFEESMRRYYDDGKTQKYDPCAIELLPYDSGELPFQITSARRINESDVEIYFDRYFETDTDPSADEFELLLDGVALPTDERYGFGRGKVHFCKMTTVRLASPLPVGEDAPKIKLKFLGSEYDVPFEDYYKYRTVSKSGVPVNGSAALLWGMKTIRRAAELVDIQLSHCPEIAEQMVKSGASLSVFGKGECAYNIPEHRDSYQFGSLYVEGFGGITCSITECNIWHWHADNAERPDPDYTTHYRNENIMIHEFGHGVKIAGFDRMNDRSVADEFQMVYRHAKAAGLWPNTYAISNSDEYFATLSAIWFNVMNECAKDDGWDGTRGPVNTRRELYNYDIDAYKFFSKIYPHRNLDGAWTPVPDNVHVTGLKDDPDPDFSECGFTFEYPENDKKAFSVSSDKKYKICDPRGHFALAVSDEGNVCLCENSAGEDEKLVFTLVPTGEEKTVEYDNGETSKSIEAYIKHGAGTLCLDGGKIALGDGNGAPKFTIDLWDEDGICAISSDSGRLVTDDAPSDGVSLTVSDEKMRRGGVYRLIDIEESKKHMLFIHGGAANGSSRGTVSVEGEKVALSAPMVNDSGETFLKWEASHGAIENESKNETYIRVPTCDTVIWARYA
ncbi:MAG: ASCH domain-containing protein [Firmicutes bacterium]|nr:ASCH domain-containing protein [Bacillota bacterium]